VNDSTYHLSRERKPTKPRTLRAELRERRLVSNRQFISVRKCSGSVRCGSHRTQCVSASAMLTYCPLSLTGVTMGEILTRHPFSHSADTEHVTTLL
jgi:hypothetical protein